MLHVESVPPRPRAVPAVALALIGGALAILVGLSMGNPSPESFGFIAFLVGVGVIAAIVAKPHVGYMVLAGSAFMLVSYAVTLNRYLGVFDLVLPTLVALAVLGGAAAKTRAADALLVGPAHGAIAETTHEFARSVRAYFILVGLTLIPMAFRVGLLPAFDSFLLLVRAVQGALLFPLGLWMLRSEARVRQTTNAILAGGALFTVVNLFQWATMKPFRAGLTWVVNHPDWEVESANEAGAMTVMLFALVLAMHAARPRKRNYLFLGAILFMLFLTQSRSGLVALFTFLIFSLRRIRKRYLVAGAILFVLALTVVPRDFWARMINSITFKKGSFEVYSFMIRVYGYQSALRVFLSNWLFGLGYLSCRFVSQYYNDLKIAHLGSENFYLETAVGAGVIGLGVLAWGFVRLFRLGPAVRRVTPPGSLGHEMARVHVPLMAGLAVANLTANNFVGMVGLAQVALWCALLVRSGHLAVRGAGNP